MVPLVGAAAGLFGAWVVLLHSGILLPALLVVSSVYDTSVRVGPVAVHPSNILLLATLAGVALLRLRTHSYRFGAVQLHCAAAGSWIVIAGLIQPGPGTAKRILALALMGCALEATYQLIRSRDDLRHLRHWLALSAVLATIRAYLDRTPELFNGRAAGVFGNPNALGMFLAGTLPLALSLALSDESRRARQWGAIAAAFAFYGLWISGSRGALIGGLVGCLLVASRHLRQTLTAGALLGLIVLGVTAVEESGHGLHRIPNAFRVAPVAFENSKVWLSFNGFRQAEFEGPPWMAPGTLADFPQSFGARMMVWYQALSTAWENPLVGIGTGNSRFSAIPFDSKTFNNCFNMYLSPLVEGGLIGFLLHLLWLRLLLRAVLRSFRADGEDRLGTGLAGAAFAFLCHGLVEDSYFSIYANWLIGIVFGANLAAAALARAGTMEPDDR